MRPAVYVDTPAVTAVDRSVSLGLLLSHIDWLKKIKRSVNQTEIRTVVGQKKCEGKTSTSDPKVLITD